MQLTPDALVNKLNTKVHGLTNRSNPRSSLEGSVAKTIKKPKIRRNIID
jgi:hypothetical protein